MDSVVGVLGALRDLGIDATKMLEVLRIGREKLSDMGTASAAMRVDRLRRQTGMARADVVDSMIAHFRKRHALLDDALAPDELCRAEQMASPSSRHRIGPPGSRERHHRIPGSTGPPTVPGSEARCRAVGSACARS